MRGNLEPGADIGIDMASFLDPLLKLLEGVVEQLKVSFRHHKCFAMNSNVTRARSWTGLKFIGAK